MTCDFGPLNQAAILYFARLSLQHRVVQRTAANLPLPLPHGAVVALFATAALDGLLTAWGWRIFI